MVYLNKCNSNKKRAKNGGNVLVAMRVGRDFNSLIYDLNTFFILSLQYVQGCEKFINLFAIHRKFVQPQCNPCATFILSIFPVSKYIYDCKTHTKIY